MAVPRRFSVTPTVTVGAYSANDIIGARLQFIGIYSGTLQSILITDNAAQNVDYMLILFDSVPTDIADNATFDIADADLPKIIARISLTATATRTAFSDNSISLLSGQTTPIRSIEGDGDIWAFLYSPGTPTYAATTDVTVVLQVLQD